MNNRIGEESVFGLRPSNRRVPHQRDEGDALSVSEKRRTGNAAKGLP